MVKEEEKKKEPQDMTINLGWEETYKEFTRTTAQYPKEVEMEYLMLGLANEVGEVLGKYKKYLRGDKIIRQDFEKALVDEMGDVLWYFVRICDMLDVTLYEVMTRNIDKLWCKVCRYNLHYGRRVDGYGNQYIKFEDFINDPFYD